MVSGSGKRGSSVCHTGFLFLSQSVGDIPYADAGLPLSAAGNERKQGA